MSDGVWYMKLSFRKRLNENETKYINKFSKQIAYKKLYNKYNNYIIRFNYYPYYIFAFLIQFLGIYLVVSISNLTFNVYVVLCLSFVGIIFVSHVISLSLFHLKNKKFVMKKLKEWDNKLEGISGDGN